MIEPARRIVRHADGREAIVEPRAMKVLVALVRAQGVVLGRDDLFEACWEGRAVSDDAVDRAIARLRRAIAPVVDQVIRIETVTKVGHRAMIQTRLERPGASATTPSPATSRRSAFLAVLILLVLAVLAGWWWTSRPPANPASGQTVGVVPFRASGEDDVHLANGFADVVRSNLANRSDLQFAVIDPRTGQAPDDQFAIELGRRLGIRYLILGRLRRDGERLQIETWLLDTVEGRKSWSDSLSGELDETLALQERVGARIASALGRRLEPVQGPRRSPPSGEVQALYLAARSLVRSRDRDRLEVAESLLREVVNRDPDFAPGWAKLGAAVAMSVRRSDLQAVEAAKVEALDHVRRALRIDPDLAEAHGTLGMILGFSSEEAAAHVRRAALLDPNDAEIQFWRGNIYGRDLDFENQLAAYRRATSLDPLWSIPSRELIRLAALMGRSQDARREVVRWANVAGPGEGTMAEITFAWARGDISEAARLLNEVRRRPGPDQNDAAYLLALLLSSIGMIDEARNILPARVAAARRAPMLSIPEIRTLNAGLESITDEQDLVALAIKRQINAGTAGPLASEYDGRGLLLLSADRPPAPNSLVANGPLVALVLRQAGRTQDAERLLVRAEQLVDAALERGPAPADHWFEAAAVWASRGRPEHATRALERAMRTGWRAANPDEMADIMEEPAFAALRADPRFRSLRERLLRAHERERREIAPIIATAAASS